MADPNHQRGSETPTPSRTNTWSFDILNHPPSKRETCVAILAYTSILKLCDCDRDSLFIRVANADVDALDTDALSFFFSMTGEL